MAVDSGERSVSKPGLLSSWLCCAHRRGTITNPAQLSGLTSEWLPTVAPCTVASTLAANQRWSFEHPPEIDADDWWFATSFQAKTGHGQHPAHLTFDGLASLAEVWLNGELLLTTDNMFRSYTVDVSSKLRLENELLIGFRSISENLKAKRPRPRWKTNLVNHQQLRWHRTSLQGRIPGWSPPAPAIGPWRDVRLETGPITAQSLTTRPQLDGSVGVVSLEGHFLSASPIQRATLRVGAHAESLQVERDVSGYTIRGKVRVANARVWTPHTHGQPALYDCELILETSDSQHCVACDPVGFRKIEATLSDKFEVQVNDLPVYCRGACWTVSDTLTLTGSAEQLRHDLTLARDAGVNMLRVGGTMVYESDTFYRLCDELGIMVWQDFMFANMDYPVEDESFRHNLAAEVTEQLRRLSKHACVVVYCGNSEIEQQAAMLGMPRELWTNNWFSQELPDLCQRFHPGTGYVPSTPTGGVLPFQPNTGLTHYYGVGAYLKPVSDVRQSDVKFTPECLGFANVPEASTIEAITQGGQAVMHDARWKRRIPRDIGAGWDFEDVRDHYLKELFHVDPVQLRSWDTPKYLQLSRLVSGEMMQRAFSEWRSSHSNNRGGLVWFYKDLWPAAGWGIIDSTGVPKAAYYFLKRVWNNRQLTVTDEGLNGLHLHLVNELTDACNGTVEVTLLKEPNVIVARQEIAVRVDGRGQRTLTADEILGGFYDVSYAYRFGPPHHDIVMVTWFDSERRVISEAYHFIHRSVPKPDRSVVLQTSGRMIDAKRYEVTLQSDRFLHAVTVNAKGYLPDDNYFHLSPERPKTVSFRATTGAPSAFKALVEAMNMESSQVVSVRSSSL